MSSALRRRFSGTRNSRRSLSRQFGSPRMLAFQPLEPRRLLAVIGDWAVLDLRSYLNDAEVSFTELSGIAFHGNQLAVTANVQPTGGDLEARLLLVDYDLDANTAAVGNDILVPSLGGMTESLAVNSNGTVVYVTGYSMSPDAPQFGEAFRATWDGNGIATEGLGFIQGKQSPALVAQSAGIAVNSSGVVAGSSDGGRAIFEYDEQMVHAGDLNNISTIYGISDDRVKVGLDLFGTVWEADNETRRFVDDPYDDGVFLFGISPDSSALVGSGMIFGVGGSSIEKLIWWTYDGAPNIVLDSQGRPIDGRLTSATNLNVGYFVGRSDPAATGDLLHLRATNETLKIVDWFESFSGLTIPAETSDWGPEIVYDYDSGHVAIISGGHLFAVKIWDDNLPPVAVSDAFVTPENVTLEVAEPGVLENDVDDGPGPLQAILVTGPTAGTLDLRSDGSFTYIPNVNFNREDSFTYRASDGSYESNIVTVDITIDTLYPWHNGLKPRDVNADRFVTAIDALQIINTLNNVGSRQLPTDPPRSRPLFPPFYDTNRDSWVSAIDALQVINYLNSRPPGEGEGEAAKLSGDRFDVADGAGVGNLAGNVVNGSAASRGSADLVTNAPAALTLDVVVPPGLPEIGFASSNSRSDDDIWMELPLRWSLGDLEDTLTTLLGGAADES